MITGYIGEKHVLLMPDLLSCRAFEPYRRDQSPAGVDSWHRPSHPRAMEGRSWRVWGNLQYSVGNAYILPSRLLTGTETCLHRVLVAGTDSVNSAEPWCIPRCLYAFVICDFNIPSILSRPTSSWLRFGSKRWPFWFLIMSSSTSDISDKYLKSVPMVNLSTQGAPLPSGEKRKNVSRGPLRNSVAATAYWFYKTIVFI